MVAFSLTLSTENFNPQTPISGELASLILIVILKNHFSVITLPLFLLS